MNVAYKQVFLFLSLFSTAILVTGCQSGSGARLLKELGFDQQPDVKMTVVEKTLTCIDRTEDKSSASFDRSYSDAVADVRRSLAESDWSTLVCLSFSDQAGELQLADALAVLHKISETSSDEKSDVAAFVRLLEQRRAYLEWKRVSTEQWERKIAALHEDDKRELQTLLGRVDRYQQLIIDQQRQIQALKLQVRELKEVELRLQPVSNESR